MKKYYKLIDIRDGEPCTLFHGIDGSRTMPTDEWVKAVKKPVSDGSSSTTYTSGLHVLETRQQALDYLEKFKYTSQKGIATCYCRGLRPKEHSRDNVWLADEMKILEFEHLNLTDHAN